MNCMTPEVIETYKNYLREEEKSIATIEKYLRDIKMFIRWMDERDLSKSIVLDYKEYLSQIYAPTSINSILSSLNNFFQYNEWYHLKVKTLKIQKQMFSCSEKELTKIEYHRLLQVAKKKENEKLYLLMQIICATGILISELKFITVESLFSKKAMVQSKGKMRIVILPNDLCKLLLRYTKKKKIKSGCVFVSRNGNPLDRSNIWKAMKALCNCAKVAKEKVFPHNLRHPYVKLKLKILFGLYHSLQSAEILHFPYNLNPFTRIHIHFINEPVSQAL